MRNQDFKADIEYSDQPEYYITKVCLYNFDTINPPFLYSKTGVHRGIIIFLIFAQKHSLGTSKALLTGTHNLCFEQKYEKYQSFFSEKFQFLEVNFSIYLNSCVFVTKSSRKHAHIILTPLNPIFI